MAFVGLSGGAFSGREQAREICAWRSADAAVLARSAGARAHTRRAQVVMGMGNSFGRLFRISTWGESHGSGVGVTVDGVPPRMKLTREDIQMELDRRRPGQSRIVTPRNEPDAAEILSGVVDDVTMGTPIAILVRNKDQRSQDYDTNAVSYRPSHADATYDAKYGIRSVAGGGRSSARETIGRVAGGAIARRLLSEYSGVEIVGYVQRVGDVEASPVDHDKVTQSDVESNIVRAPDAASAERMIAKVDEIRKTGNSIGGVVEVVVRNVPAGLGSPVFDKLEADLAKACMSLPASKGFEVGSGFAGTFLTGLEHNDPFYIDDDGRTRTVSNRSGGIQGGISNGENIILRVAFKPTSTIGKLQKTVTREGHESELRGKGRHDPCVLPRAVPMRKRAEPSGAQAQGQFGNPCGLVAGASDVARKEFHVKLTSRTWMAKPPEPSEAPARATR
ncbi:Chorismate synthase [Porphyridium purpureum]|uniref:Chorismate synthase n=1 Tax=Porphyridium purpureum TaxID=35688 RepID=A0A5J4YXV8_PORPP|nr:Chorismate synthase [Porphyridium purpureum]|eukprot:POR6376..scf208_2